MKLWDCKQGTEEWKRLRMGRPTASEFHRIITPGGKPSDSADPYVNELLGELILGGPLEKVTMPWMAAGSALEAEAREFYEFNRDVEAKTVGFCTTDDERIGASPDAMVGDDGLLEIKCPQAHAHVGYLLGSGVDKAYSVQAQGQLYVTGREWVDLISYYPGMPHAVVRLKRNEDFLKLLAEELKKFVDLLDVRREKIQTRGWIKEPPPPPKEWLTEADIEQILAAKRVPA